MIATRLSTFNNLENKKPFYPELVEGSTRSGQAHILKQKREDFLSYPLEQILSSGKTIKWTYLSRVTLPYPLLYKERD
jgi:hypothetical protein